VVGTVILPRKDLLLSVEITSVARELSAAGSSFKVHIFPQGHALSQGSHNPMTEHREERELRTTYEPYLLSSFVGSFI
jgi:hypothetical protein